MPLLYCVNIKLVIKHFFRHHLLLLTFHGVYVSSFQSNNLLDFFITANDLPTRHKLFIDVIFI